MTTQGKHIETHAITRTNMRVMALVIVGVFMLDQITKFAAEYFLVPAQRYDFLPFMSLRLVHNAGAAWGIFSHATFALGVVALLEALIIILFVFQFYRLFNRNISSLELYALSAVVAGGFGNAFDRFVHGKVTDFFEFTFIDFPIFNVADIGVTVGIFLFLIALWTHTSQHTKDA